MSRLSWESRKTWNRGPVKVQHPPHLRLLDSRSLGKPGAHRTQGSPLLCAVCLATEKSESVQDCIQHDYWSTSSFSQAASSQGPPGSIPCFPEPGSLSLSFHTPPKKKKSHPWTTVSTSIRLLPQKAKTGLLSQACAPSPEGVALGRCSDTTH